MSATATKERGVIFRPWEVQATMERRKSQFRRPVKPQPVHIPEKAGYWWYPPELKGKSGLKPGEDGWIAWHEDYKPYMEYLAPYAPYAVGQRLWVRETFWDFGWHKKGWIDGDDGGQWASCDDPSKIKYVADHPESPNIDLREPYYFKRPSTQMPRWASRITLEVTEVRCEKVAEISEEDAISEGVTCWVCGGPVNGTSEDECGCFHSKSMAIQSFQVAYEAHHGPGSFDRDWVWVVGFDVLEVL